jgi:hypothetical protein
MKLAQALGYWWNGEMSKEDALAMVREQHEKYLLEQKDEIKENKDAAAKSNQYKERALRAEQDQVLLQKKLETLDSEAQRQLTAAQEEVVKLKGIITNNALVLKSIMDLAKEQENVNMFVIGERIIEKGKTNISLPQEAVLVGDTVTIESKPGERDRERYDSSCDKCMWADLNRASTIIMCKKHCKAYDRISKAICSDYKEEIKDVSYASRWL